MKAVCGLFQLLSFLGLYGLPYVKISLKFYRRESGSGTYPQNHMGQIIFSCSNRGISKGTHFLVTSLFFFFFLVILKTTGNI